MDIITSLLDNDLYKFTMQHGVFKLFPFAKARYGFINRGQHKFPDNFAEKLQKAVNKMGELKLTLSEKEFLKNTCPYLNPTYLDFLQGFQYDPAEVIIEQVGDELSVKVEGFWYRTILWEVPLMSLICELYYNETNQQRISDEETVDVVKSKIIKYRKLGIKFAEFGTRRRHSFHVQNLVVKTLSEKGTGTFMGTSNVYFAMKNNIKPIGTHAHEWFMFHAAKYGYKMANSMGLEHWVDVYRGDLGIALTDTYTTEVFFNQFDKKFAKLFDGVRHDSGDPLEFGDKTIAHYEKLGVNPKTKAIIFSDGLNFEKVEKITKYCQDRIHISFGIGTNLTNDVGVEPMNIVIKMLEAKPENDNWTGIVKLSDEPLKHTGNLNDIELAKRLLHIK